MRILKTVGIAGGVASLLFAAPVAFAETPAVGSVSPTTSVPPQEFQKNNSLLNDEQMRAQMQKMQAERELNQEKKRSLMNMTAQEKMRKEHGVPNEMEKMRLNDARQATSTLRDMKAAKERMEAMREEAKNRFEAQREKNEKRFAEIKDKAKQEKAKGIAKQFAHLNEQWTDHFMNVLDHLDEVVKKIQSRADRAASSGKDVSATVAAIKSAKTAIDTARAAVVTQAGKVYELNTSTSSAVVSPTTSTTTPGGQSELVRNLSTAFKALHTSLFKDLTALRDGPMLAARRAVQAAAQSLASIPRVDEDGVATTTSATTTTAR